MIFLSMPGWIIWCRSVLRAVRVVQAVPCLENKNDLVSKSHIPAQTCPPEAEYVGPYSVKTTSSLLIS
jgi:hypothetical protein